MNNTKPVDIDSYIEGFPEKTQKILQQVRAAIRKAAPGAEETISYGIPTFKLYNTYLVYFAGYDHHIGFYPAPIGMETFKKDLANYKTGKGSVQFPLDQPMPLDLITRIVKFRVEFNREKAAKKKKKKA
jgi:uncharacterized protein YdhG (YjbR/CyaY superfamily)